VTLWGYSAGGSSTCAQMSMPSSRGLFHRAILESGPCRAHLASQRHLELDFAIRDGAEFKADRCAFWEDLWH
jgi:carboxylesterase type B